MRPYKRELVVTAEQKAELRRLVASGKTPQAIARRARIILLCDEGLTFTEAGQRVGVTLQNVAIWRNRFIDYGIDGLNDANRRGRPRTVDDDKVEEVVRKTLNSTPPAQTHWSQRQMAARVNISRESVGRIWRAFGLKPHLSETFELPRDPDFVEKVKDVVGLYVNPPTSAVVLSVDEKTQVPAHEHFGEVQPMQFGHPERHSSKYIRHGITNLFAALDVATGRIISTCARRRGSKEFVDFLKEVDAQVDPELDLHIIVDNLNIHKSETCKLFLLEHPRVELHFLPTYSSWLNLIESFFSILQRRALARGNFTSVEELEAAIEDFIEAHNDNPTLFKWTKTAEQVLEGVSRYCKLPDAEALKTVNRTSVSPH